MLERQSISSAFRPFLKINGCDVCENFEWHVNLHEVVRYVSRDESNRLHLVREEWTGNVRMDVTHSVTTRISPGSRGAVGRQLPQSASVSLHHGGAVRHPSIR